MCVCVCVCVYIYAHTYMDVIHAYNKKCAFWVFEEPWYKWVENKSAWNYLIVAIIFV